MFERVKALYSRGSSTEQQLEEVAAGYETAKAAYEQMKQSVELRAPFSGVIIAKHYNNGENFSAMKPGPQGIPAIVTLARLNLMELQVQVPERDFVQIREGLPVTVHIDVFKDSVFRAQVTRVSPSLDLRSRTATITIDIPNPRETLKPGMFARTKIITRSRDSILLVPSTAIVMRDEQPVLFKVANDTAPYTTKPQQVRISVGLRNEEFAEVESDSLSEGELVVYKNNVGLKSETLIEVVSVGNDGEE
jgi:RND family efflux transporter MFP subunit